MLILESQSANNEISKCQNGSLDYSLDELAVLRFLKKNPDAKQRDTAKHIGKSERTIKRITPSLIERGLLERENGKRNGRWVVKLISKLLVSDKKDTEPNKTRQGAGEAVTHVVTTKTSYIQKSLSLSTQGEAFCLYTFI